MRDTPGFGGIERDKVGRFRMPQGGIAYGYSALLLAELCDTVLAAREAGKLHHQQHHIADRWEVLMRAAANWGQFQRSLKRAFPVLDDLYEMNLGEDG